MYLNAESVKVDTDEGRLTLEVDHVGNGHTLIIDIHGIDLDAFYDSVKGRIGPYLRERDEDRTSRPEPVYVDSDAYPLSSPKHPDFHSVHADIYDQREGK